MSNPNGRPSMLDHVAPTLLEAIRQGLTYAKACQLNGITHQTMINWRNKGIREKRGKYFQFFEQVEKARVEGEKYLLDLIRKAAEGKTVLRETKTTVGSNAEGPYEETVVIEKETAPQWQAGAWILERRLPEVYGRKVQVDVPQAGEVAKDICKTVADMMGLTNPEAQVEEQATQVPVVTTDAGDSE